jgi:uncharacterized damage-inducible protein DinB
VIAVTAKALAVRALDRTGKCIVRAAGRVPAERWQDSPGGKARSLRVVLRHLTDCEWWWLVNLGIPLAERPRKPPLGRCESPKELTAVFRQARKHLLTVLEALPDSAFDEPSPAGHYPQLTSLAELMLYASQHDFYHLGQINTLELAFRKP